MKIIRRKYKAFTLIEIIVVLIILGVLASIALPAYFSLVSKSRSAEVFVTIKQMKDQVLACLMAHPYNNLLGPNDPANTICKPPDIHDGRFMYRAISVGFMGSIMIDENGEGNGYDFFDEIRIEYDINGNRINCFSSGKFSNSC